MKHKKIKPTAGDGGQNENLSDFEPPQHLIQLQGNTELASEQELTHVINIPPHDPGSESDDFSDEIVFRRQNSIYSPPDRRIFLPYED